MSTSSEQRNEWVSGWSWYYWRVNETDGNEHIGRINAYNILIQMSNRRYILSGSEFSNEVSKGIAPQIRQGIPILTHFFSQTVGI